MKSKYFIWLKSTETLTLSKVLVFLILIAIFCVSCVQLYDRYIFHKKIKEVAKKETNNRYNYAANDTATCIIAPANNDSPDKNKPFPISKHIVKNSSYGNYNPNGITLLDIMSKSDGLMSANGLTFCVTLIISLLATLVVIKIETNEKIIRETIEKEIAFRYISTSKFNHLLARIESIYNLSVIIGIVAILLRQNGNVDEINIISTNIGNLCSRLSPICKEIDDRLTKRGSKLDLISQEEKSILNMYLEDTLGELKRSLSFAEHINSTDLCTIINNVTQNVENIKESINLIELVSIH